jgi:hypothetical protein
MFRFIGCFATRLYVAIAYIATTNDDADSPYCNTLFLQNNIWSIKHLDKTVKLNQNMTCLHISLMKPSNVKLSLDTRVTQTHRYLTHLFVHIKT